MCPVNLDKIKQERAKAQFAGELIDFPEGETACYFAAFPYPDDEVPYASTKMHYGLGPKGFSQGMCLEPAINEVLNNPHFNEQLALLDKDLSGGCPVCEDRDAGKKVSGDPEQDGKPSGRYLYIVMPKLYRPNANAAFQPWPKGMEVKGFLVGWKVWDKILDQFGACGDITDPDAVILIRVIREGKKLSTKWEIQPDIETARKPIKLSKEERAMVADMMKPGGPCDPYRILASMARTRQNLADLLKGIKADDGAYEEVKDDAKTEDKPAEGGKDFKPPPGKGGGAKKDTAAKKPAKEEPGDGELKQLTAKHGSPPNCFKVDPDPGEEMCQKCPFKVPCANHCGVPVPPDPGQPGSSDDAAETHEADGGILVEQAEPEKMYTIGDTDDQYTYKGPAKGKHLFVGPDGKPVKLESGAIVKPVESTDDDPGLKKLEAELAAKKAAKGKGK